MARKTTKAKDMTTVTPDTTDVASKPVRVELAPDMHRLLRKVAADVGISMAAFARDAVVKVIREEAKARGIKG